MKIIRKQLIFVALFVISLIPLLWYRGHPGELINGLDTNFPLNPAVWFTRRLFLWNDSLNGGLHMNSSVSGLFFHFLQYIPYKIGFSLQLTQKLTFIFWFGMTTVAAYCFARTFISKKALLQFLFVLLYSLNIYLFNTWENSKVANLALVVAMPLVLTFIELYRQRKISILTLSALQIIVAIISAGAGINPAYFAATIIAIGLYFIVYLLNTETKRLVVGALVSLTAISFASSFWVVPLLDFMFLSSKVSTLEGIGFTNWVASLSQNTSLVNLFRIMGAWDWYVKDNAGIPIYIPYAVRYFYSLPFIVVSFLVPLLSFLSLLVKDQNKKIQKIFFLTYLIIGIFLGAGLHEPTGGIFSILLNKVPFFSFFRSPWYIFTPYTIIGLSGLAVMFFEYLYQKIPKIIYYLAVFFFIGSYILYSYPLWTGKIFRPGREDGFYVKTPEYVFEFSNWIEKSNYDRIVTYPDDQLEKFNWGYKGTDSILGLLINKEVYAPSFNYQNRHIESYLNNFYLRLKEGFTNSAVSMLPTIGVDSILLKKDAQTLSPEISSNFTKYKGISFGPWQLVDTGEQNVVSVAQNIYSSRIDPSGFAFISPFLPKNSAIIDENDSQISKFSKYYSTLNLVEARQTIEEGKVLYEFETLKSGNYTFVLENIHPLDKKSAILLDGKAVEKIELRDDARIINLYLNEGKHLLTTEYPIDIASIQDIYAKEITLAQLSTKKQTDHRTQILVENFSPFLSYDITFDAKYYYGDLPQIEVVQSYEKAPLKVETIKLAKNQDWYPVRFHFEPVPLNSKLELITKLPTSNDASVSKFQIQNLKIDRIVSNRLFVYETSFDSPQNVSVSSKKINPVNYQVEVRNSPNGYFLLFKENYQNGWNVYSNNYIGGNPVHLQANGMYNLWYIPVGDRVQNISINFVPQRKYVFSLIVSGIALIFAFAIVLVKSLKHYGKRN